MISFLRRVELLVGRSILVKFALSIPLGLSLGGIEVLFGISLYAVLTHFGFLSVESIAGFPEWINPVAALIALAAVLFAIRFISAVLPTIANEEFNTRIRNAVSERSLGGVRERSVLSTGDVSHIVASLAPRTGAVIHSFTTTVAGICTLTVILASMFFLSWKLSAVSLGLGFMLGLPVIALRRASEKYSESIYAGQAKFIRSILKDVRNVHLLKISGTNDAEIRFLQDISNTVLQKFIRYSLLFSFSSNLPIFAGVLLVIFIIWLNGQHGYLPVENFIPFVYLLNRAAGSVSTLAGSVGQFRHQMPFFRELLGYTEELIVIDDAEKGGAQPSNETWLLEVNNLTVGRSEPLVKDVTFTIRQGETLIISGESGRGKTTLLMTLIGLINKLDGTVKWNDVPVELIDPEALRRFVGYAGPEPYLIDGSIFENLRYGAATADSGNGAIRAALECACAGFVHDLPNGTDFLLSEGGEGISAGQKQRLALARCLLRNPTVLILDEATANVDEPTERLIMERIRQRFPDILIIAVSHRSSMRQFASSHIEI